MKLIDTLFGKVYYTKRVKVIKKIRENPLRKLKHIPGDVKRMINANCVKTLTCPGCALVLKRRINLRPDGGIVNVNYRCEKCGWGTKGYTLLYPKKVKKMVSNSSPLGIKTWWGIKFVCPRCCSGRVKLIIKPESITKSTVFVHYKCKSCNWGAMYTLNIVRERA